jgi:hypothetical protein
MSTGRVVGVATYSFDRDRHLTKGQHVAKSKRSNDHHDHDSSHDHLFDLNIRFNTLPFASENINSGRAILTDPHDRVASPSGWIDDALLFMETNGNNANVTLNGDNIGTLGYTLDFQLTAPISAAQAGGVIAFTSTNYYHDL